MDTLLVGARDGTVMVLVCLLLRSIVSRVLLCWCPLLSWLWLCLSGCTVG